MTFFFHLIDKLLDTHRNRSRSKFNWLWFRTTYLSPISKQSAIATLKKRLFI